MRSCGSCGAFDVSGLAQRTPAGPAWFAESPAREAGEAVPTLEERLGSMKRGAGRLLVLVLGLVAAGCTTDNIAWLKYRSGLILTDHRRAPTRARRPDAHGGEAAGGLPRMPGCWLGGGPVQERPAGLPGMPRRRRRPERTMSSRFISAWTITTPWVQAIGHWLIGHSS